MRPDAFPLFILTMTGDEARRAPLLDWLSARGITWELFFGVDGREGLAEQWEASIDRRAAAERLGRKMGDGEFACALSHQEIYRVVLERGLPGAVILEDDAVPAEQMTAFLAGHVYRVAPMMLLDHGNTRVVREPPKALPGGLEGHRVAVPPFYTTAYSINAKAAEFLRENSFPISFIADWPCDISRVGAVALMPRVAAHQIQGVGTSHLQKERQKKQRRAGRFAKAEYWARWWRKRCAVRLPDAEWMQ